MLNSTTRAEAIELLKPQLGAENGMLSLPLHAGAQRICVPAEQMNIPCHDISCQTFDINQRNGSYSVIAGHFGVLELKQAGITGFDCLFNIRDPVDRSLSCLFHFYEDLFKDSHRWSTEKFKEQVTEASSAVRQVLQ